MTLADLTIEIYIGKTSWTEMMSVIGVHHADPVMQGTGLAAHILWLT